MSCQAGRLPAIRPALISAVSHPLTRVRNCGSRQTGGRQFSGDHVDGGGLGHAAVRGGIAQVADSFGSEFGYLGGGLVVVRAAGALAEFLGILVGVVMALGTSLSTALLPPATTGNGARFSGGQPRSPTHGLGPGLQKRPAPNGTGRFLEARSEAHGNLNGELPSGLAA